LLVVSSSYTFEEGDKPHQPDAIFVRSVDEAEVKTKPKVVVVLGMEATRLSPFVGCYSISFIIQYFMERLLDPKLLISRHG
jgi:hypothetical protein